MGNGKGEGADAKSCRCAAETGGWDSLNGEQDRTRTHPPWGTASGRSDKCVFFSFFFILRSRVAATEYTDWFLPGVPHRDITVGRAET